MFKKIYSVILILLINITYAIGQNKRVEVKCGEKVESAFTLGREWQSFTIELEGGDNLRINSYPKYGEYLKYNIDIYGPSGNMLFRDLEYKSIHQIETGQVPGPGLYSINPFNYKAFDGGGSTGHAGEYITEFICERANGEIISPENKVNSTKSEIALEEAQFFSIPFGTPIEGEITPGSNQLFGFKTRITQNDPVSLDFSVLQGNMSLEIQVLDPVNKSIVFYSILGNANSLSTKILFPSLQEFLFSIKEASSQGNRSSKTKFKVLLRKL